MAQSKRQQKKSKVRQLENELTHVRNELSEERILRQKYLVLMREAGHEMSEMSAQLVVAKTLLGCIVQNQGVIQIPKAQYSELLTHSTVETNLKEILGKEYITVNKITHEELAKKKGDCTTQPPDRTKSV